MTDKINMNIVDGDAFFSHDMSINFNPTQFILDFRCITPRIDARAQGGPTINVKHNVVLVEPYHAKQIYELLGRVLKKYEDDFGTIQKPAPVQKFEKKNKNRMKVPQTQTPSYLG